MRFEDEIRQLQKKSKEMKTFNELLESLETVEGSVSSLDREQGHDFLLPYSSHVRINSGRHWKISD